MGTQASTIAIRIKIRANIYFDETAMTIANVDDFGRDVRYVTNLQLRVGDSAVANQPMLAVIDANSFYVQAFFRETFAGNFQKGDRAVVTLMSYPDTPLEGSVDSIGWGIAQQNGSTGFEQLPSVKPTFEWIIRAANTGNGAHREGSRQHRTARRHHGLSGGHHRNEHGW